jgi:hypothetical protein
MPKAVWVRSLVPKEKNGVEADQSHDDQIDRHDEAQRPRHDQDQDAGEEGIVLPGVLILRCQICQTPNGEAHGTASFRAGAGANPRADTFWQNIRLPRARQQMLGRTP